MFVVHLLENDPFDTLFACVQQGQLHDKLQLVQEVRLSLFARCVSSF